MKFGIVIFPGSNCDNDCVHVCTEVMGKGARPIWHKERDVGDVDCLILPGGFSYGDYLRSGAMAACSPVMESVKNFASRGGTVIGICNGFQILQEARLLPGALIRNETLRFICRDVDIRVERTDTPFTCALTEGQVLRMPIANMDGNFFAGEAELADMERSGRILFRYCGPEGRIEERFNPNGSRLAVAGVVNEAGNVCGMMPHPERASEALLGGGDGIGIFKSILKWAESKRR